MADTSKSDPWDVAFEEPQKASPEEIERWRRLRLELVDTARRYGWTKTEVSKRSAIAAGTLWQWFDGTYNGVIANQSDKVEKWLDAVKETGAMAAGMLTPPSFIQTPSARRIIDALLYAQTSPEMVLVTMGSGMGKTATADHFAASRPHAYKVTMRPYVSSVHGMLMELAIALDVNERSPARLDRAIGDRLKRNGRNTLLIIDESQHLGLSAVNQLRYFLDIYGCGIALLGNEELYDHFGRKEEIKPAYAQVDSRFGLRIRELAPVDGDISALIAGWRIEDEQIGKLAAAIGRKPGALRLINKTLQLAGMFAAGDGRPMTAADVRQAFANRGFES